MNGKLENWTVVITGAGSGIGRASAWLFAEEGAHLVLVDRDTGSLNETTSELTSRGATVLPLAGDVGDEAAVLAHVEQVIEAFGRIDVLLACAGFSSGTSVPETSLDTWESILRANLTGSFLWSKAVLQPMRQARKGSIILVGSQLAMAGGRSNAAYVAAKGGIVSLAQAMAVDHAAENIRVNTIIPGTIDTPLTVRGFARNADPEKARSNSIARHPLGRLGQPGEVAKAALFLASDDASFTTGSCLRVDGGWLAG